MKIYKQNIVIEHLGYTIIVRDIKKYPSKDCVMYVEEKDNNSCYLNLPMKVSTKDFSTIAHEVLHCLQYIAENRNIDLTKEVENSGYLMQFILNKLLGFKYST